MEEYNVLYLDKHNGVYLIGNHVMNLKHVIYDNVTEELLNDYLDKYGQPKYIYENNGVRLFTNEEKSHYYPELEASQLDRIEQQVSEVQSSLDSYNTYKINYLELTDGAEASPTIMRANIQALMKTADDTSIINAEPFIDEYVNATAESPIEHKAEEIRKYNNQVYSCIKDYTHNGEPNREPDKEKTLWKIKHTKDKTNPKPFIQPTGAHDVYMQDECCLFEIDVIMKLCTSKVDNNSYSPKNLI